MNNLKYYLCIIIWTFMPKSCIAAPLDFQLSDVIHNARLNQMKIAKSQIQENVQQTKKQFNQNDTKNDEQNAVEKLNPDEIMKNQGK